MKNPLPRFAGTRKHTRSRLTNPILGALALAGATSITSAELTDPFNPNTTDWYTFSATGTSDPGEIGVADYFGAIPDNKGRVYNSGGTLMFDGAPLKLWGINAGGTTLEMPTNEADDFAKVLAKYGVNLVRFHKIMEQWSPIMSTSSSVDLDATGMADLDLIFKELKDEGIFINFSPSWHYTIKTDDRTLIPYWMEFYNAFQGSNVVIQAIDDGKTTTGTGTFSFDAVNDGPNIEVGAKVYGVNGDFDLNISQDTAPAGINGGSVTLLRDLVVTNDTGTSSVPRSGSVNFGTGYDYLIVVIYTNGFLEDCDQWVDNMYLGTSSNIITNADFSSLGGPDRVLTDNMLTTIDDDNEDTAITFNKWSYFKPSRWEPRSTEGYFRADGNNLDHPNSPHIPADNVFGQIPGYVYFLTEFQDIKIAQVVNFLNHNNPYTGNDYADDPQIAFVEMQNETSIGWDSLFIGELTTHRQKACEAFCQFLRDKYSITTQAQLEAIWGADAMDLGETKTDDPNTTWRETGFPNQNLENDGIPPVTANPYQFANEPKYRQRAVDTHEFLYTTQNEYYDRFKTAIVNTGYTGELISGNWTWSLDDTHYLNLHSDSIIGTIDRHQYAATRDRSQLTRPGSAQLHKMSYAAVKGNLVMVSEWAQNWVNPGSSELRIVNAAWGMGLQGWDVMSFLPGLENVSDGNAFPSPMSFEDQFFNQNSAPILPIVARLIHRRDVDEGTNPVTRKVYMPDVIDGTGLNFDDNEINVDGIRQMEAYSTDGSTLLIPREAPTMAKMEVEFTSTAEATPQYDLSALISTSGTDTFYDATNGQLTWRMGDGLWDGDARVNTPRTQGVVGYHEQNVVINFDDIDIKILDRNQFAAIFVTTKGTTGTIADAEELIVVAVGRARNTGMVYQSDGRVKSTDEGTGPVLMEPVNAEITFKRSGDVVVTRLDHDGVLIPSGTVTVDNVNNKYEIDGVSHQTPYYLVEITQSQGGGGGIPNPIVDQGFDNGFTGNGSWAFSNDPAHLDTWVHHGTNDRWSIVADPLDAGNDVASVTSTSGVPCFAQIIVDNGATTGIQDVTFKASNIGSGNTLEVAIWGVNEDFRTNLYDMNGPRDLNDTNVYPGSVILAVTDVADQQMTWPTEVVLPGVVHNINFGSGYDYILIQFKTNGVSGTDEQMIDDVVIGGNSGSGGGSGGLNIVDGTFDSAFLGGTGWAKFADLDAGWVANASSSRWNHDATNKLAETDSTGAGNLVQIISDPNGVEGTVTLDFDAINTGGDTLEVYVYGVDAAFDLNLYDTQGPRIGSTPVTHTVLVNGQSFSTVIATMSPQQISFPVPTGGFQYYGIMFRTTGASGTDELKIDNVTLNGGAGGGSGVTLDFSDLTSGTTGATLTSTDSNSNVWSFSALASRDMEVTTDLDGSTMAAKGNGTEFTFGRQDNSAFDITELEVFNQLWGAATYTLTATLSDSSTVSAQIALSGQSSSTMTLNWTDVISIEVDNGGGSGRLAIDDVDVSY